MEFNISVDNVQPNVCTTCAQCVHDLCTTCGCHVHDMCTVTSALLQDVFYIAFLSMLPACVILTGKTN